MKNISVYSVAIRVFWRETKLFLYLSRNLINSE